MTDFKTDLEYSLEVRESEFIDLFYMRVFPLLDRIEVVTDLDRQKLGIDKVLWFANGDKVTIDEKRRRTDWGDVLLELWSNYERRTWGWLFTMHSDYIVYIVVPSKTVLLLPVLLLRCAWKCNGKRWRKIYPIKDAYNPGYKTRNIFIPTQILLDAISKQLVLDFGL